MTVRSGLNAVVDGQAGVQNWTLNDTLQQATGNPSNARGGTVRRNGVRDWTGGFLQHTAAPALFPGDYFTFTGYTNEDASGAGAASYSGPAIVDSIALNWDWAGGGIINTQVNFGANGVLTPGTATGTDATNVEAPPSACTKIQYSTDGTTFVEWTDLTAAVLTISKANPTHANSSTCAQVGGAGPTYTWTHRRPGVLDWTLALTEENSDGLGANQLLGTDLVFRLFVDDSDYWEVKWGKVGEASGLNVDRATGQVLGRTINIAMNASRVNTAFDGHIINPAGTTKWPV